MNLSNFDAESSVLGSVLLEPNVMDEIGSLLEERDFYTESHQIIWRAMWYKWDNDEPIDLVTVAEALHTYKRLNETGGVQYLTKLAESVPSTANVAQYANIIRSKSIRRRIASAGQKMYNLALESDQDDQELIEEIEKLVSGARPGTIRKMQTIAEIRKEYFEQLGNKEDTILTGFKTFDEWMGGVGRGWLYIIAGRPSAGKTAKSLQMARGIAKSGAGEVLIWSQEMTKVQILNRMLASVVQLNGNRLRRKELNNEELERANRGYNWLEKLPLHIDDASGVTIDEIRSTARKIKRQKGKIGAIIVDYLQIMKIVQRKDQNRSQAIGEVTRTAKAIAKEMDCPFFMLAQMSREGAKNQVPELHHLKESGDIEQDADVVEFLYEADEANPNGKVVNSKIAKGRDVGVNQFKYIFKGWIQRFDEYE
jgi:replicative DNA helicase